MRGDILYYDCNKKKHGIQKSDKHRIISLYSIAVIYYILLYDKNLFSANGKFSN